jgi:hypothetical protein
VADLLRTPNHRKHMPAKRRGSLEGIYVFRCAKPRIASLAAIGSSQSVLPKALESVWAEHFRLQFFATIRLRDMDRCSGREVPAVAPMAGFHAVDMCPFFTVFG